MYKMTAIAYNKINIDMIEGLNLGVLSVNSDTIFPSENWKR